MNGRVYNANIGRFISADPFIQAPNVPMSHNRYAYVLNNPYKYTDLSGYFSISCGICDKIKKIVDDGAKTLRKKIDNAWDDAGDAIRPNVGTVVAVSAVVVGAYLIAKSGGASDWGWSLLLSGSQSLCAQHSDCSVDGEKGDPASRGQVSVGFSVNFGPGIIINPVK